MEIIRSSHLSKVIISFKILLNDTKENAKLCIVHSESADDFCYFVPILAVVHLSTSQKLVEYVQVPKNDAK